ncbi:ATP-binding protein [Amaricoccus sp.]|uniref:ATP-binding protein n=1 Tax=Amaricoccus sp. TaxID=1872485 RepID=UPI001B750AA8|nr:ATP-binding protein [Amaricoccus sp.]MBP7003445.1 two-component sensor histidine kinase [Amaricoccus sp.]
MQLPSARSFLPHSLFGRALMILLVPMVLLQLLVGLVFFQRHYLRVTEQMTRGVALELRAAMQAIEAAPDADAARADLAVLSRPLRLALRLEPDATLSPGVRRPFDDLTGRALAATLEDELPGPLAIDLASNPRVVHIGAPTGKGVLVAVVPRNRMSVSNPHQLLVLMVGASLVLGAVAVLFLRNQVRPIRQLAEASEAFGKGRSVPFRPAGAEEVRRAGNAFLSMRSRIERQIEQRTQMLSGVSHDLRTPLTRMRLTLELLDADEDEVEGLRGDISQMERMLEEFLAFARGDQLEESAPTDPFLLAGRLVEDAERGGARVTLAALNETPQDPYVQMRPVAVRRALENLVGNAARYGEHVALSVRLLPKTLDFVVEDDGPGIAPEDRARALAPFSRLDAARNQDAGGGVGLGLAIALDVARGHGGSLELGRSPDLGGLRAVLRLPR